MDPQIVKQFTREYVDNFFWWDFDCKISPQSSLYPQTTVLDHDLSPYIQKERVRVKGETKEKGRVKRKASGGKLGDKESMDRMDDTRSVDWPRDLLEFANTWEYQGEDSALVQFTEYLLSKGKYNDQLWIIQ